LKVKKEDGKIILKWNQRKNKFPEPVLSYWKGYLMTEEIIIFLDNNCLAGLLLHTEFSHSEFKCYDHPVKSQQDWLEVEIQDQILEDLCFLSYLIISNNKNCKAVIKIL